MVSCFCCFFLEGGGGRGERDTNFASSSTIKSFNPLVSVYKHICNCYISVDGRC